MHIPEYGREQRDMLPRRYRAAVLAVQLVFVPVSLMVIVPRIHLITSAQGPDEIVTMAYCASFLLCMIISYVVGSARIWPCSRRQAYVAAAVLAIVSIAVALVLPVIVGVG